jgi:hypothetical protein
MSGQSIHHGSEVKIIDINRYDSFSDQKENYIGQTGVVDGDVSIDENGWCSCHVSLDSGRSPYFFRVKFLLMD